MALPHPDDSGGYCQLTDGVEQGSRTTSVESRDDYRRR
jgi:hypothetical protein